MSVYLKSAKNFSSRERCSYHRTQFLRIPTWVRAIKQKKGKKENMSFTDQREKDCKG